MKKLLSFFALMLSLMTAQAQQRVIITYTDDEGKQQKLERYVWDVEDIRFEKAEVEKDTMGTPEMIDLGLSVKWATKNVGAKNKFDSGTWFGWGELSGKNRSTNISYYPTEVYGQNIVNSNYDIPQYHYGDLWRMPTVDEMNELIEKCEWSWYTNENGVNGYLVRSKENGNSIFLPFYGYYEGRTKFEDATFYWTGSIDTRNSKAAQALKMEIGAEETTQSEEELSGSLASVVSMARYMGMLIRPVYGEYTTPITLTLKPAKNVGRTSAEITLDIEGEYEDVVECAFVSALTEQDLDSNENFQKMQVQTPLTNDEIVRTIGGLEENTTYYCRAYVVKAGETVYSNVIRFKTKAEFEEPELVDLGLSVKWAAWNVGASQVCDHGGLYAWGDPTAKKTPFDDSKSLGYPQYHFQSLTSFQIKAAAEIEKKHNWYVIDGNINNVWTASDKGITASNSVLDPDFATNHLVAASKKVIVVQAINLSNAVRPMFYYDEALEFADPSQISGLRVLISRDYTNGDAFDSSKWIDVTRNLIVRHQNTNGEYVNQALDLTDFAGSGSLRIAFEYSSTESAENVWCIKNARCEEYNQDIVGTKYDLPHVKWGSKWRMPTRDEFEELCELEWKNAENYMGSGVNGWLITAENGNQLFLPKSGFEYRDGLTWRNYLCSYWTGEAVNTTENSTKAYYANIDKAYVDSIPQERNMLMPIRAVYGDLSSSDTPSHGGTDDPGQTEEPVDPGTPDTPDTPSDPDTPVDPEEPVSPLAGTPVDLGLSILWADVNVGATTVDPYGDFYAWGEVEPSANTETVTKACLIENYRFYEMMLNGDPVFTDIGRSISENSDYDAARKQWGGKWRMPLMYEYDELVDNCTTELETQPTGVVGYRFTSKKNGKSIFIPCGGNFGNVIYARNEMGYYWTGSLWTGKVNEGQMGTAFRFDLATKPYTTFMQRHKGALIRPVMSK